MIVRVDTADGYLNSVLIKEFSAPATLLATITAGSITNLGGGAYNVDVGATAGSGLWLLVLRDANNETIGIRYAGLNYSQATDEPRWLTGQSAGLIQYTVNVKDNNNVALQNVVVLMRNGANTATATTNASGNAVLFLFAGSWTINISEAGYAYAPQTVVVTGTGTTNAVLNVLTSVVPNDPMLCVVNFFIWGDEGPIENAKVLARIEDPNARTSDYLVSKVIHKALTDSNGLATLQLIQLSAFVSGGIYLVEVFHPNSNDKLYTRRVTVPNQSVVNAAQLVEVG